MRIFILILALCSYYSLASAAVPQQVTVKSDFLEVFTGAGRGYPVFFVVEKGENFQLLKKKMDWIKIRSPQGQVGWVSFEDYSIATQLVKPDVHKSAVKSDWELGLAAGLFGPDYSYTAGLGYYFKPEVAIRVEYKKIVGEFSHSNVFSGQFIFQAFRRLVAHPFISIGVGRMDNTPRQSLINANQDQQNVYHFGGGFNYIPYKRLNLRLSLNNYYLEESAKNYLDVRLGVAALFGN